MTNKNLSDVSTKELVEELKKREGVETFTVAPYEEYGITVDGRKTEDTGPVIILRIED